MAARFSFRAQMMAHANVQSALQSMQTPVHFTLPPNFLTPWPLPSNKPCTKLLLPRKNRTMTTRDSGTTATTTDLSSSRINNRTPKRKRPRAAALIAEQVEEPPEDYSFFRPTCARIDDALNGKTFRPRRRSADPSVAEQPRNARDLRIGRLLTELPTPSSATKQSSRALRWNQRRLEQVVGRTNALASKEAFLRFGRSKIHAWGVFAEKPIEADELIIEYRGELIGNAVAERREVEYAQSLGRDYMFRIDAEQVCDATKQGNVARFINASCEPNCYTKIITFDGAKRIAIYAKRDISEGEELSYDYKFEPGT
jgi:SET domain